MALVKIMSLDSQKLGNVELDDRIFKSKWNPFVVKDAVVYCLAKKRQGTHKVKGRSEVRGSRRKLYRQKGTGNARAGSAQSPVRRGGGVAIGPKPRDHSISLNKKVRKQAMVSVISELFRNDQLVVVDSLELKDWKTKTLHNYILKNQWKEPLFITKDTNKNLSLSGRNLPDTQIKQVNAINVYDILNAGVVVITQDALSELETRLVK